MLRSAALGIHSHLPWFLLLTGFCCWHAHCNPAQGKANCTNSKSPTTTGQFCCVVPPVDQSRSPNTSDLRLVGWIHPSPVDLRHWASAADLTFQTSGMGRPSHAHWAFCSKTFSCCLKNIMRNLSTLTPSHNAEKKWLKWQLFEEHAQSTGWIHNCHGFTQRSLTVCESNDKLKTSLALHHSQSEL